MRVLTVSLVIVIFSGLMFLVWLRFTVRLLVAAKPAADPNRAINTYDLALSRLQADPLQAHASELFERDYVILMSLLAKVPNQKIEFLLLRADFRLLQVWSLLLRPFAPILFHKARLEMVAILQNLAGIASSQA
jgi:hypothetical protein